MSAASGASAPSLSHGFGSSGGSDALSRSSGTSSSRLVSYVSSPGTVCLSSVMAGLLRDMLPVGGRSGAGHATSQQHPGKHERDQPDDRQREQLPRLVGPALQHEILQEPDP